jgi:hypothetical protein
MQLTQSQVRETTGISVETFRHWKRVLPPFSERRRYSSGDLLAAGVLHRLTDSCGVRAGHLPEISKSIVEICNANAWASLQSKSLVIDVQRGTCALVKSARALPLQEIVIVCPLGSVIAHIQEELARKEPAVAQRHLHFPPVAVGDARSQRQRA